MKKGAGTSLPEQSLFFYVRRFFPDAINRFQFHAKAGIAEVDIFIPSRNIAIEYDGSYWHKNQIDRDNRKNSILNDGNIYVIHVRGSGLPSLAPFIGQQIDLRHIAHDEEETYDYINRPLAAIAEFTGQKYIAITVTKEMYQQDLPKIYAQIFNAPVRPNLTDYCAIDSWLYDINAPLAPENIPQDEWAPAYFKCPNGERIPMPRYDRVYKTSCIENGYSCSGCLYGIYCKFMQYCKKTDLHHPVQCDYMIHKIVEEINAGHVIGERQGRADLERFIFNESSYGLDIITWFLQDETTPTTRKNILNYFGMTPRKSTSLPAWTDKDIEILKKFRGHPDCAGITIRISDRREEANGRLQWQKDREKRWLETVLDNEQDESITLYVADSKNKDEIDKIVFRAFAEMPSRRAQTQYTANEAIHILMAKKGKLREPRRYILGTQPIHLLSASHEQSKLEWDSMVEFWVYIQNELQRHGVSARLIFSTHTHDKNGMLLPIAYGMEDLPKFHYSSGELVWLPLTFFDNNLTWRWITSI